MFPSCGTRFLRAPGGDVEVLAEKLRWLRQPGMERIIRDLLARAASENLTIASLVSRLCDEEKAGRIQSSVDRASKTRLGGRPKPARRGHRRCPPRTRVYIFGPNAEPGQGIPSGNVNLNDDVALFEIDQEIPGAMPMYISAGAPPVGRPSMMWGWGPTGCWSGGDGSGEGDRVADRDVPSRPAGHKTYQVGLFLARVPSPYCPTRP